MDLLSNAYRTDDVSSDRADPRAFMVRRDGSDRTFRAATRHSRHVRWLRIGIPAGVAVMALVFTLAVFFNPLRVLTSALPVDIGNLVVSGSKITMEQPRLAGFTRDNRGYELTARAAAQDLTKPTQLELQDLSAKIEMQDQTQIRMSAKAGVYDTKVETLVVKPDIVLKSSNGYEAYLSEASVDIRKGYISSEKPVSVKLLNGTLNSNWLEIINTGEVIRFGGGVTMTLDMSKSVASSQPPSNTETKTP